MARQAGAAFLKFTAETGGVVTGMEKARAATREAARDMRKEIHESKEAMELLGKQAGIELPRSIRTFLAELPGVASALSAAFNGAALLALGGIAVEEAKKVYEFFSSLNEMGEKINEEFEKVHDTLQTNLDQLAKTNDELQNTINKFEGKKENTLKVRLDDAALAAGALVKALQQVADQEDQIMKKNAVGVLGRLAGKETTSDIAEQAKTYFDAVIDMSRHAQEEINEARKKGDEKQVEEIKKTTREHIQAAADAEKAATQSKLGPMEHYQWQVDALNGIEKFGLAMQGQVTDSTAAINSMKGHIEDVNLSLETMESLYEKSDLEAKKAGQTGLSAAELQKKAIEKQMQELRTAAALREALAANDDALNTRIVGNYIEGVNREMAATEAQQKQITESLDAANKGSKERAELISQQQQTIRQNAADDLAATVQAEQMKVEAAQESNVQRIANVKDAMKEYEDIMQQSFAAEAAAYTDNQAEQEKVRRQGIKDAATFSREMAQINREQMNMGIQGAMDEMVRKAIDTASTLRDIFTSMVNGINDQLVKVMSGQRTNWRSMFGGVATQAARAGLNTAEGYALKALGIAGKPDGTQQKPFFVKMAEDIKKAGTDIAGVFKGSPDASTSTGNMGIAHTAGGLFASIFGALIPHASGGVVTPGSAYLVGEHGPEPFFPGVSGTIGTNAAMHRAFGSAFNVHMPIDARGATDPAAVNIAVHRALSHYMPTIVTASAAFQQEMKRRTPALGAANF